MISGDLALRHHGISRKYECGPGPCVCCEHFVLFHGLCEKFGHGLESSSTSQLMVVSSLQNTGSFREVAAFDK